MSEEIVAAKKAIEQILAGLHITTVICIDDVYDIKNDKTMYDYMFPKLTQLALEHKEA